MKLKNGFFIILISALFISNSGANDINNISATPYSVYADCPKDGDPNISKILKVVRKKHRVPAICAAIVTSDGVKAIGAAGVRKIGTKVAVTVNDKWHLGSDTKVMTACIIGQLVEQGKINWNSTLSQIFPELEATMLPEMKKVTVLEILSHRAGLQKDLKWREISGQGSLRQQRYNVVKEAVYQKPLYQPGSKYSYSNLGYVVAGAIIEKITNSSWEEQIKELIFEPLNMTTAGFGGTGTPGQIDQPWGHFDNGTPAPKNGVEMDNPLVVAPAGCVNCSIEDWSKFIIDQLKGAMGKPALLKPETYKMIQTPHFDGDYALGWAVVQRNWGGGGMVLNHCGNNTMNYANVWIAPKRNFAILVCINQGGDIGFQASDDAVWRLINYYFKN